MKTAVPQSRASKKIYLAFILTWLHEESSLRREDDLQTVLDLSEFTLMLSFASGACSSGQSWVHLYVSSTSDRHRCWLHNI